MKRGRPSRPSSIRPVQRKPALRRAGRAPALVLGSKALAAGRDRKVAGKPRKKKARSSTPRSWTRRSKDLETPADSVQSEFRLHDIHDFPHLGQKFPSVSAAGILIQRKSITTTTTKLW